MSCENSSSDGDQHHNKLMWSQNLDLDWNAIESNDDFRIYYFPVNSDPFYNDETSGKDITDFMYNDSLYELDAEDYRIFVNFVSDSSNFTGGECGTYALNSGFVIEEFNTIHGFVNLGCGFMDWRFHPFNNYSQGGSVSDKGFAKMSELLDGINAKR